MVKLLQKIFFLVIGLYAVLIISLYFSSYSFGININSTRNIFQSIVPDSYSCYDGCNRCTFYIFKLGLLYVRTNPLCTSKFCSPGNKQEEFQLCRKDWKKSQSLKYKQLLSFTNSCLNGYRNITYLEKQKKVDKKFTLEDSQSLVHTRRAISQGIDGCNRIYHQLKQENRFSELEILKLGAYLRIRKILNSNNKLNSHFTREDIIKIKEMFDYLKGDRDRFKDIISDTMLQQFQDEYDFVINSPSQAIDPPDYF